MARGIDSRLRLVGLQHMHRQYENQPTLYPCLAAISIDHSGCSNRQRAVPRNKPRSLGPSCLLEYVKDEAEMQLRGERRRQPMRGYQVVWLSLTTWEPVAFGPLPPTLPCGG